MLRSTGVARPSCSLGEKTSEQDARTKKLIHHFKRVTPLHYNIAMPSIPTPKTPGWLQRLHWIFDPVSYFEGMHARYPDIFRAKGIGYGDMTIITSHPQALQQILTSDRQQLNAPTTYNGAFRPLLGDNGVILLEGEPHRQRRQLVMPSFHGERLRAYGTLIGEITERVMGEIAVGQTFLARQSMQSISLLVIIEAIFGVSQGERYQQIKRLLTQLTELFDAPLTSALLFFPAMQKDFGSWSPWGKFLRQRQQIDELVYAEIRDRQANFDASRTDILSLLMEARDERGKLLSDVELRDELMTLLLAGHETTATAMSWGLYWLHRTPSVKAKLLAELSSLGDSPDPMEIARLPYLSAVCNETLRICPVAMLTFARVTREPIKLLGYPVEPGEVVMGCMFLTHQREDIYPNPQEFKPERFIERQYSPYEFIPFGGGARRCLGEALAQFEMKLVLASIVQHYQMALSDRQPEKLQRRGLTLAPARGVKMIMLGKTEKGEKGDKETKEMMTAS